jgi:hypothetical protein
VALSVACASGATIPIINPSFETLPADGLPLACFASLGCAYSDEPIPGWTNSGFSGQFQPGTQAGNFTYFDSLADGPTSAYSNDSTIAQTVAATVQAGIVYTLLVDIGRNNVVAGVAGTADLLINGKTYLATGVAPASGNWSTFSVTYVGLPADVGEAITIELKTPGLQGNFDNVHLTADEFNVPEPGTFILGFGLISFWALGRRKRTGSFRNGQAPAD